EKYEPSREKEIDRRALFHAADNKTDKDTLAPQTAREPGDELKAGHASGNTKTGKTTGEPNAKLEGRYPEGVLPKPKSKLQEEGTVVVTIWVDQYGKVTRAQAGADGTTVVNSKLWAEARSAAMGSHFNTSADAPALQKGTITYIFKLK
ncbi:MAG: energy transducer TonB, partial [Bacteroidales bacterium]|nr:energy transducer TonB [Bacteroidales bacterium]